MQHHLAAHHDKENHPLQQLGNARRLDGIPANQQTGEQIRDKNNAQRVELCQPRHNDGGEAIARRETFLQAVDDARHFGHTRQPCQPAAEGHDQDDIAREVDARIARRAWIVAHNAHFKAPARALPHNPQDYGDCNGNKNAEVGRHAAQKGECLGIVGEAGQPGCARELRRQAKAALAPRAIDEEVVPENGDIVEHQCRDDLIDIEFGLEDAGDNAPDCAADEARHGHRRKHQPGR